MVITRKIGEVFQITDPKYPYGVIRLKVVEQTKCQGCFFNEFSSGCSRPIKDVGFCSSAARYDSKSVGFMRVKDETIPSVHTKCTFCEDFKVLRYNLDKNVTAIVPVQGSTFHTYKEYKFRYCPVCGKELK